MPPISRAQPRAIVIVRQPERAGATAGATKLIMHPLMRYGISAIAHDAALWQLGYSVGAGLDFRPGFRPRASSERSHIIGGRGGGAGMNAPVALEDLSTERRQRCAAPPRAAGGVRPHGLSEGLVHAVKQKPRPLVGHPHFARCSRDRAGIADALKEHRLARADASAGLKNDADPHARHAGTLPRAGFQIAPNSPKLRGFPRDFFPEQADVINLLPRYRDPARSRFWRING